MEMDTLNVCRACLSRTTEETNLSSVFSVCGVPEFDQQTYSDLITSCTSTRVLKDDNLPKNICHDCIEKLFISYNFKIQCEASYNYLITCKPLLDPKLENIDNEIKREDANDHQGNYEVANFFGDDEKKEIVQLVQKLEIPFFPCDTDYEDTIITKINKNKTIESKSKQDNKKEKRKKEIGIPKAKQLQKKYSKRQLVEGGIKCRFCDVRYRFRYLIEKHENSHFHNKEYYCKMCDKNYHSEESHKTYHLRNGTFECDHCGKVFKNKTVILNHITLNHRGERPVFKCDFQGCEKSFFYPSILANHRATHDNKREVMCELCSKTFLNRGNLKLHMTCVHSDVKRFKCKECDRRFKTSSTLHTHYRSHHLKSKPQKCHLCSASFLQANRLKRHMVVHTKHYQHECVFCSKTYSRLDGLKTHIKTMHGIKPDGSSGNLKEFTSN